jgi:hypothetical protein
MLRRTGLAVRLLCLLSPVLAIDAKDYTYMLQGHVSRAFSPPGSRVMVTEWAVRASAPWPIKLCLEEARPCFGSMLIPAGSFI